MTKGKKSTFVLSQPILLPIQVEDLDLSNVVRVFEMLIRWDREADRSL
jgi:hypothetical protein